MLFFLSRTAYWHGQNSPQYRRIEDGVREGDILLDEDSKRLIEDAKLFIQRDSLLVMEVIGQGKR